jgi:hypothetical protein
MSYFRIEKGDSWNELFLYVVLDTREGVRIEKPDKELLTSSYNSLQDPKLVHVVPIMKSRIWRKNEIESFIKNVVEKYLKQSLYGIIEEVPIGIKGDLTVVLRPLSSFRIPKRGCDGFIPDDPAKEIHYVADEEFHPYRMLAGLIGEKKEEFKRYLK